jgi:hypothetical protein
MFMTKSPAFTLSPDSAEVDPIPEDIRAVIELYTTHLAKVSFPDVDVASLRRDIAELRAEADNVARARAALDVAIAAYNRREAALSETAVRAVAYARIYSGAHPDHQPLAAAIMSLAKPTEDEPKPRARRRGRPPRRSAELFDPAPPNAD